MAFTAVDKGETYFNTVLYTGNDTARDITTGLVSTDFIWNKSIISPDALTARI